MNREDRELGMGRRIQRRDFLNGMAVSAGALLAGRQLAAATDYYPPTLTGMRGSHDGAYEASHKLRDHKFWANAPQTRNTGEEYDLVIVGGGISGLSAAHFYRQTAGKNARILIVENHDDFGGHAKRNEFHQTGRMLLGYGGTYAIESPAPYSAVAKGMVAELGIDVSSWPKVVDKKLYPSLGMGPAVFFDKERFGADRLVRVPDFEGERETVRGKNAGLTWESFAAQSPLSDRAKKDLVRLYEDKKDYLPGFSSDQKKAKLARMSYARFLTDHVGVDAQVVSLLQARPQSWFGVGIDAVSAQDAWGLGSPGFDGMNLAPGAGPGMNRDAIPNEEAESYFFHFPDGNSSIARLLVRKLIPAAIPGSSASDVVTSHADYSRLDEPSSAVRIRLNSSAVRVDHIGDPVTARQVEVTYMKEGKLETVRAAHCILACWHVVIPYICTALPEAQKQALASAAKVPLVYTDVVIRNWHAWRKLGVSSVYAPGSYHTLMDLDAPVSIGDYRAPRKPDDSIVVHMQRVPCHPGLPAREQHKLGRIELFGTTLDTFERNIREQMGRTLGPGGFDPARDIAAITVNRWPHGYAYEYNSLWDPFWLDGGEQPCVVARQPFGRITIANADAGAYAYTDCAMDQAYRAVHELTGPKT
jgi:spermidine dehydrogenase